MKPVQVLGWAAAGLVLALTWPRIAASPSTTYGGAHLWLLAAQVCGAVAWLVVGSLAPPGRGASLLMLAGATWLVPELAGVTAPLELRTLADSWAAVLAGVVIVTVVGFDLPDEPESGRKPAGRMPAAVAAVAVAGALLAGGARLVMIDPFLDVGCWRSCDHNPLLLATTDAGRWLEAAGALALAAAGTAIALKLIGGAIRVGSGCLRVTLVGLVIGVSTPGVLRLWVTEWATSPPYVVALLTTQACAVLVAAQLAHGRIRQWRLGRRLHRIATEVGAVAGPGAALAPVLGRAVRDPGLKVRYWAAGRNGFVDAEGHSAGLSVWDAGQHVSLIARQGQPVAAIVHSASVAGPQLDRALGAALRLALENEQLRAATLAELLELEQSRARIVERSSHERRRLERDLHDGAQQRLVSLSLLLRMLAERVSDPAAGEELARAQALTASALAELRRVARGIYPAVLADSGLAGALLDLAESSTDLAVEVSEIPAGRYPGTVETSAYLVVAAAIDDARRRGATGAQVTAAERDGMLAVQVTDDSRPPERHPGADLADQISALSGRLLLESVPGGTRIGLELPCAS